MLNHSSPKVYKTHIKEWGLDKKNKEPEIRAIIRKNKQRADQGKRSNFRVRGRDIPLAEVVRYSKRKGVSYDEIIARKTASPTPETVEVFTPVPSPVATPQDLAIPESLFGTISQARSNLGHGSRLTHNPVATALEISLVNHMF